MITTATGGVWNGEPVNAGESIVTVDADGTLRTARLLLVEMPCVIVSAVLQRDWTAVETALGTPFPSEWRGDGWQWLAPQLERGQADAQWIRWGTRLARLGPGQHDDAGSDDAGRDDAGSPVVAEVGFHGPPDSDGLVEIGYRVVNARRRHGIAEEAVRALLRWACMQDVEGVKASVHPANAASLGLLRKLGFATTGARVHPVLGDQVTLLWPAGPIGIAT